MSLTGYDLNAERAQYGIYNATVTGDTKYKAVTVSFSTLASKQGNTIINQQLLPMVARRIEEDPGFLVDDGYKKIFILSSYLRENGVEGGRDINRVLDDNNSLSLQIKCLNTMNFSVHSIIPVDGLDIHARYENIEQLSSDAERINASNAGNVQVKTVEFDATRNLVIGNAPKLEGNASKFFAIRMYAALMLNKDKRYQYDLSRVDDADTQIATLKHFADYINSNSLNYIGGKKEARIMNSNTALNTILYGPPGTGKTWNAINVYAKNLLESQVGQELSAEEVLADSLKELTWWQVISLALYSSGRALRVKEILSQPLLQAYTRYVRQQSTERSGYSTVMTCLIERSNNSQSNYRIAGQEYFVKNDDLSWALTDLGRSFVEDELSHIPTTAEARESSDWSRYYRVVTFHQSYSYEEFVEGIRPKMDSEDGSISYEIKSGIFKELCVTAGNDPENKYLIIIDEINRGNIAKIFGELITLIEEDKRDTMSVVLPYSQEKFTIPKNLYVLGTMNTADRSIALLDIALRRRFEFDELMPLYNIPEINREVAGVHIGKLLKSLNDKIAVLIDRDHQIGHSYFMKIGNEQSLYSVWYKKVLPLIQEYFYNDWEQLEILLGSNFVESRQVAFQGSADIDDSTLYSFKQFSPSELPNALKALIANEEESSDINSIRV